MFLEYPKMVTGAEVRYYMTANMKGNRRLKEEIYEKP